MFQTLSTESKAELLNEADRLNKELAEVYSKLQTIEINESNARGMVFTSTEPFDQVSFLEVVPMRNSCDTVHLPNLGLFY